MLVLTLKPGQRVHIGPMITVHILKSGSSAKIGIEAPPSVHIVRGELLATEEAREQPATRICG